MITNPSTGAAAIARSSEPPTGVTVRRPMPRSSVTLPTPSRNEAKNGLAKTVAIGCGNRTPRTPTRCECSARACGFGAYPSSRAAARIRVTVVARRRSGSLNACETAAVETPAFPATSWMVTLRTPSPIARVKPFIKGFRASLSGPPPGCQGFGGSAREVRPSGRAQTRLVQKPARTRADEIPRPDPVADRSVAQRLYQVDRNRRRPRVSARHRRGARDDGAGAVESPPGGRLRRIGRTHAIAPHSHRGRVVVPGDQLIERQDRSRRIALRRHDGRRRRRGGRGGRRPGDGLGDRLTRTARRR